MSGLGGIGKSTLALHFAHTYQSDYTAVWWIDAETPETITESMAQLTTRVNPGTDTSTAPSTALAEWALAWLETHPGWLLVFDNATHPDHLAPHLARLAGGDHLITSRLTHVWHELTGTDQFRPIHLDVLSPEAATGFLCQVAKADRGEVSAVNELAKELGYLPLALAQASMYIRRTRITYSAYLHRFRTQAARMLGTPGSGDPHSSTIARTWRVTLDTIADRNPLAVQLLRVIAWLAPHDIPRNLLGGAVEEPDAEVDALALLDDFSMITLTESTVACHRLVQALARTPDSSDPHRTELDINDAQSTAATLIRDALPVNPVSGVEGWPRWRALLPHIDTLLTHVNPEADTAETTVVLYSTSQFLLGQGQSTHATRYARRAVTASARLNGEDHPDTLTYYNSLANTYEAARDLDQALPIYEKTLADAIGSHGEDHPVSLVARSNLARAYRAAGNLDQAIPLFEKSLTETIRIRGEHPRETLGERMELARAYEDAGNLDRAILMFEKTVADATEIHGGDHPVSLAALNDLARAYRAAGNLDQAIPIYEQALTDTSRILGENHPLTLFSCSGLAHSYQSAGNLDRAIPMFEKALSYSVRIYDKDHPDLLVYRSDLANSYRAIGDMRRALPMFERTLTESIRLLGETHRRTLTHRTEYADAYRAEGDLGRAIPMYEQTLNDAIRTHGEDPLLTMAARNGLARAYQETGDLGRAVLMYEQALGDTIHVLGEEHLKTLAYRINLADAYRAVGDMGHALPMYEKSLTDAIQFHGEEHPVTWTSFLALAGGYEAAGDLDPAVLVYEYVHSNFAARAGEGHPVSRMVWDRLQQARAKRS
ncbi:tetratricopeptide repeat protein [Streptomyces mirabilis]|uniref:tetratricopeptide repeat protein n=1 Tax=Streptomyces mirabilis TaxID=68239 RepID=UPI0033BDC80F